MDKWVFINDKFVPSEQAYISIYDHGFLYGDGVFEGIRAYNGNVFKLKEHTNRLYRSLKALWIDMPFGEDVFIANVKELIKRNEVKDCYIRVTVSRGEALGLDPKNVKTQPTIIISTDKLSLYPQSMYENGLEVVTVATRVANPQVLEPRIKSTGKYIGNIQAKLEANHAGAGEGLMLTEDGHVAECTGDNIYFVKEGVVYTPAAHLGILEGITRQTAIELLQEMGVKVVEGVFTRLDLYSSDECFLSGTGAEIIPVSKLDGRKINDGKPGPLTKKLIDVFHKYASEYKD